ncbi:hypothetical protein [Allorhizocola rhizosphaerae]|uniref:hypothetical protein n=1 Tax=Allorhizocola rhizosphaerae TaxID=1872709 RepID=UPI000E3DD3C1|nr:hypothetical protein [Allorhizocola rhizosphaerae]
MSFEQLMQHADDIARRAWRKANENVDPQSGASSYSPDWFDNLRGMCEGVPGQYEPFSKLPNPSDYDAAIDMLKKGLEKLSSGQDNRDPISTNGSVYIANPVLTKLSGAESYIEGWTGKAAMEFKSNFIDPFPAVVRNQFIVVAAIKSALEAEKAMWQKAREDVDKVAHDTITALDNMGESGKNEWTMTFTVVASIAAVGATLVTAGGAAGIAITAVGAASQVVAAAAPDDPPKLQVSGEHPDQVLRSMGDCLRRLQEEIDRTDKRIADALMSINGTIHAEKDSFVSKRPALATATKESIKDPSQMGYSSD